KTKISNIVLCPGVDEETNIPFIYDAEIQIVDNTIVYAGKKELAPNFDFDEEIDGKGNLAMPGMINLHTHTPMTLLRSIGGNYNLEDWLNKAIFPREKKLSNESVAAGTKLGIMEMLRYGTTCYCDMYMFMDAQAKVVESSGMRAALSYGMTDFNGKCEDFEEGLRFAEAWNNKADGRITTCLAPHSTYLVSEKLLELSAEYAKKLNIPIHTHVSETQTELANVLDRFGLTPSQMLDKTGILDCNVIAAHCVWLTDEDFYLVSRKNFTVAHNPISNLKLASGIANSKKMLDMGIPVGLGTDGVASNNNLNLWEELKAFPLLQKGKHLDPVLISPAQALKAVGLNGAKALGYNNLGLIKEGYLADIILVSLNTVNTCPQLDLEQDLIYAMQGSDVLMTMVNGKVLYKDGQYTKFNTKDVLLEAKEAAKSLSI
ncbi:MAG: amidohydrolase, partial [Christensenellaceae bacterium]|nr:amidohydrolase [Christensenellaceae bacterium]